MAKHWEVPGMWWHSCRRWWDQGMQCPLAKDGLGPREEEDDDDAPDEDDTPPIPIIKRPPRPPIKKPPKEPGVELPIPTEIPILDSIPELVPGPAPLPDAVAKPAPKVKSPAQKTPAPQKTPIRAQLEQEVQSWQKWNAQVVSEAMAGNRAGADAQMTEAENLRNLATFYGTGATAAAASASSSGGQSGPPSATAELRSTQQAEILLAQSVARRRSQSAPSDEGQGAGAVKEAEKVLKDAGPREAQDTGTGEPEGSRIPQGVGVAVAVALGVGIAHAIISASGPPAGGGLHQQAILTPNKLATAPQSTGRKNRNKRKAPQAPKAKIKPPKLPKKNAGRASAAALSKSSRRRSTN